MHKFSADIKLKEILESTKKTIVGYQRRKKIREILYSVIYFLMSFLAVYLVVEARLRVADHLYPTTYQYLSLVVFIFALLGNKYGAISASILSAIAGNFYLMEPSGVLKLDFPQYLIPTVTFLIQSLLITFLTSRFRARSIQLKKLQKTLEVTKEKFNYATSKDSTFFIVTSFDGYILDANKTTSNQLGKPNKSILGEQLFELSFWTANMNQKERLKEVYTKVDKRKSIKYEDSLLLPKRGLIDVEINIISTLGEMNEPIIILTFSDISDKKANIRRNARERKVYTHLLNSEFMGLVFTDQNRRITNANNHFQTLIGRNLKSMLGSHLSMIQIVPERYHSIKAELIKKIQTEGFGGPVEIEFVNHTGAMIPVLLSGVLFDSNKDIFLFFIVDLSELKKLEKKKDEFISVASHEIKTPLTIIKGYLQLIDQRKTSLKKEKYEHILTIINGEVEKLNSLLEELLDISRIETNRLLLNTSPTDLKTLIENILESIKPLKKSREIHFEVNTKELVVNIDGKRITQVLMNLLTNAIKHTSADTKIIVRLVELPRVIRVEVQDYGEGIHPQKKARIFDKFFQIEKATPDTKGMGLGLYISKAIIETHHGKIGVKSKLGKGSTFYFELPKNIN